MALQRKNFRCGRDGGGLVSPIKPGAITTSSGNGASPGVVISHAELPPRQRKRVHVGSTNLSLARSVSTPDLPPPRSSLSKQQQQPRERDHHDGDGDLASSAAHRICETNLALIKQSMATGASSSSASGATAHRNSHLVVHSEKRRLQELAIHPSPEPQQQQQLEQLPRSAATTATAERVATNPNQVKSRDQKASERLFLLHTRKKLYDAFVDRYGSVRAVFKAFDRDAHGLISFQRFADMVEASEVGLSPDDVRRVFRQVDTNGDNTIAFQEFSEMFTASEYTEDASAYSPVKLSDKDSSGTLVTADPTSSVALKFRAPLDLSPRTRERMKELRLKVNGELLHKHGRDVSVHGGKTQNLLIYAFKQFDADNDGFLSYEQVKSALGKDFLKLSMATGEMDEMVRMIDRNADEKISMKEFVQYFGAGKRELPTDLIDNGRRKELAALHVKANAVLTPRAEFDPEYFERMRLASAAEFTAEDDDDSGTQLLPSLDSGGCMQEGLLRRMVATSPVFRSTPLGDDDKQHQHTHHYARQFQAALIQSPLSPTRRAKKDCGPTLTPIPVVSQDRFLYWREQRTDWSRVGVGGDGVRADAALFASERERLQTTSQHAFSPMRRGVNSGDVFRDQPSTSELEAYARASRRQARHAHTQALLTEMETQHAKDERIKDWKQRAKVKLGAERRFQYLDAIHDQEQRVAMREPQMAKRHGGVRYHRMWAGSPDSQFNNTHVTGFHSSGEGE